MKSLYELNEEYNKKRPVPSGEWFIVPGLCCYGSTELVHPDFREAVISGELEIDMDDPPLCDFCEAAKRQREGKPPRKMRLRS